MQEEFEKLKNCVNGLESDVEDYSSTPTLEKVGALLEKSKDIRRCLHFFREEVVKIGKNLDN